MEGHQRLAYLFDRYQEKKCTPDEREEFFSMLRSDNYDDLLRSLIGASWNKEHPFYQQDKASADAILQHILQQQRSNPIRRRLFSPARAAIFIGLLLSILLFRSLHKQAPALASTPTPASGTASLSPADSCLTLPDGSKILLHNHSTIEYSSSFSTTREVTLHGEAYFDIRPDPRPFIVHSGPVRTTVLGTAFNINALNKDKIVITVTKGKVKVENGSGAFSILHHDQQLSIDSLHSGLTIPINATEAISWKKSYLLFNDETMNDAMNEVAARYHFSFVFANPALAECRVTASFTSGESFDTVLKILTKINNMDYAIEHSQVTISGEGCK